MRSVTAAPAPLYGTCVILMPARRWKSSPPMWPMVPLDDDAMLILPGFFFAASTRSFSDLYGELVLTTRISGCDETSAIGAKSLSGSYGMEEYNAGFTARLAVCPIAMV